MTVETNALDRRFEARSYELRFDGTKKNPKEQLGLSKASFETVDYANHKKHVLRQIPFGSLAAQRVAAEELSHANGQF